ncbi:MAG: TolC family protein [Planctomycetota bacterium]|nr:MAG: TolC family protein [Planctomycetota bacterium]
MRHISHSILLLLVCAACSAPPSSYSERVQQWQRMQPEFGFQDAPLEELRAGAGLSELWEYAQRRNPGLQAAFHQWRAALETVVPASSLPQPRLSFAVYLAQVETRSGPMQGRIGLQQSFPWFGRLQAAGEQALALSEAARENLEGLRAALRQEVLQAYWESQYIEQAILVTEGHLIWLQHLESVSLTRFETGRGEHADLLRAQVEIGQVQDRLRGLQDWLRPVRERLNAALGRPSGSLFSDLDREFLDAPKLPGDLIAQLPASSPELRALQHQWTAARFGVEIAEKDYFPGFTLGADWTWIGDGPAGTADSGQDAVAISLGLDLPLRRSSLKAGKISAQASASAARDRFRDRQNRLVAEIETASFRFRDADRRVQLYRHGLMAKSEQSLKNALTAYQTGRSSFDAVVDAARLFLEFQLQAVRAEADRLQAVAEIERFSGRRILDLES